ncbi:hypothetical protein KRR38_07080 [Novosphingobium sp. G106]|uniref:hypothetical protein n=1 Tax=Novosphingobium sp. G106 TaxID=2849500 RepID=UPI001C2CD558|nr:hypothetical protein [Novosphingobium sp. G106]MBV1687445.1 hypothetical protein [Novosphingobium sp. G106]
MRRIVFAGLAGCSAITALAWWLANRRIQLCRNSEGYVCALRATEARDSILVWGLATMLLAVLASAVAFQYGRSAVSPGSVNRFDPPQFERGISVAFDRAVKARITGGLGSGGNLIRRRWLLIFSGIVLLVAAGWPIVRAWQEPVNAREAAAAASEAAQSATDAAAAASDAAYDNYSVRPIAADPSVSGTAAPEAEPTMEPAELEPPADAE